MSEKLTPKERETLVAVKEFWAEHGRAPSIAEVAKKMGLKRAGAQRHMSSLRAKKRLSSPQRVFVGEWRLTPLGEKDLQN